jgi:hypothetical protein
VCKLFSFSHLYSCLSCKLPGLLQVSPRDVDCATSSHHLSDFLPLSPSSISTHTPSACLHCNTHGRGHFSPRSEPSSNESPVAKPLEDIYTPLHYSSCGSSAACEDGPDSPPPHTIEPLTRSQMESTEGSAMYFPTDLLCSRSSSQARGRAYS